MAEFSVEVSGRVAAPLPLVWAGLTDLGTVAQWLDRVDETEPDEDSGPLQGRWRVGRRWISGTIVDLEAPRRLSILLRDPTSFVREIRLTIRLAAAERGTAFRVELDGDASGMAAALRPWLRLRAEIELYGAVRGFRSWIEERAQTARPEPPSAPRAATQALPAELAGVDLVGA